MRWREAKVVRLDKRRSFAMIFGEEIGIARGAWSDQQEISTVSQRSMFGGTL